MDKNGLYGFMLSVITDMELQGRYSTAHVYHCALKSAVGYGGTSLRIEDLSPVWLHNYQEHLLRQALLWNTISTYMRMLRAVYNRAVDLGLAPYIPRQFKNVFTGRHVNHRRALKKEEIRLVLVKGAAETADEVRAAVTSMAADRTTVTSTAADDDQDQAVPTQQKLRNPFPLPAAPPATSTGRAPVWSLCSVFMACPSSTLPTFARLICRTAT